MAEPRTRVSTGSLLHPLYGTAAQDIRAAVGVSSAARMDAMHRRLDGVRRAMVLRDRDFRGLWLKDSQDRVTPDHQKFIEIVCPDGSIRWERGDSPHQLRGCVDPDALDIETGCTNAFRVVTNGTDDVVAEGCDTLELAAGCGVEIEKTGAKELTIRSTGVREVKVGGVSCESECQAVDLQDSCSICWDIVTSGPGDPCVVQARVKWETEMLPITGDPVQVRICGCDGIDLVLSGILIPSLG
jgi:hypothetical protein